MSDKVTTYVPGKTTSFTPSRNAQWTEDFYELQIKTGLNKSALTEQLIIKGLTMTSHSNLDVDLQIVDLDKFSEEEIQLISTSYFKNQINQYISFLLDQHKNILMNSHEQYLNNPKNTKDIVSNTHEAAPPALTSKQSMPPSQDETPHLASVVDEESNVQRQGGTVLDAALAMLYSTQSTS